MYAKEADFKQAVINRLKDKHAFVTNVESHETGVGIPDTYCCWAGHDCWIEFKNDSKQRFESVFYKIQYRPGQLAWHNDYHFKTGKYVVTLMSVADGVVLVRGSGTLLQLASSNNIFPCTYKHLYEISSEEFSELNLLRLLNIMSNRCKIPDDVDRDNLRNRDMVITWLDKYFWMEDNDPEVIWPEEGTLDEPFNRDMFDSYEYQMFCNCKYGL